MSEGIYRLPPYLTAPCHTAPCLVEPRRAGTSIVPTPRTLPVPGASATAPAAPLRPARGRVRKQTATATAIEPERERGAPARLGRVKGSRLEPGSNHQPASRLPRRDRAVLTTSGPYLHTSSTDMKSRDPRFRSDGAPAAGARRCFPGVDNESDVPLALLREVLGDGESRVVIPGEWSGAAPDGRAGWM